MKLKLTCVALSALLLGSCAKDTLVDVQTKSESVDLLLSATSAGTVTITKTDPIPETKPLEKGVSIGVYVAEAATYRYENTKFVSGDNGVLPAGSPLSLTVDKSYDIYSYAPFKATVDNPDAILVNHGEDVLWAPKYSLTNVSKDNCTATLAFKHCGARISFNVKFADDFTAGTKLFTPASVIEVSGFYKTGSFNLPTGVINVLERDTNPLREIGKGDVGFMTLGIPETNFLPRAIAMELKVKVTHENKTYNGSITTKFETGTLNKYSITINGRSPDLAIDAKVDSWVEVLGKVDVAESN